MYVCMYIYKNLSVHMHKMQICYMCLQYVYVYTLYVYVYSLTL